MKGLILCGGKSSRMGTDKGLLKQDELTWTEIAAQKLAYLDLPILVSINAQQLPEYSSLFKPDQLILDRYDLNIGGPLIGLLSAHLQFPQQDLFVLACDMRDISLNLLQNLYNKYREGNCEASVYSTDNMYQPLCGIYSCAGLTRINDLAGNQQLQKHTMMHVLERLKTITIPVKEEDFARFINYNTPEELIGTSISTKSTFNASHKGQL